jgi:hypothetical protein
MSNKKGKYAVGYRKPPKSGQFRKGISGNPIGRAKGGQNIARLLAKALNTQVVINENGKRRTITKQEAFIIQIVNKAASGDLRAIQQLLQMIAAMEGKEQTIAAPEFPIGREDQETIQQIARRMQMITQVKED